MRVALPHQLGREEVRRRLQERSHEIADYLPGGMAEVESDWIDEDRLALHITAMGQAVTGHIDVYDEQVVVEVKLSGALAFFESAIESAIRKDATKMLEAPKKD
ncbi:MAG: hypothetical protein EP341_05700 [Sphingomonadales bacterium]|nr:MAG: hypothetical protein EP341_05700 [Sphingomonadales bacterium]